MKASFYVVSRNIAIFKNVNHTWMSAYFIVGKKDEVRPRKGHEGPEGEYRYSVTLPLVSALDGGGWSTPSPCRFTPGSEPVPIV